MKNDDKVKRLNGLLQGDLSQADGMMDLHGEPVPFIEMPERQEQRVRSEPYEEGYRLDTFHVKQGELSYDYQSVFAEAGGCVGDVETADRFIKQRGIAPELSSPEHHQCSIGFCDKEQKWYGWSHRAMYGFGIGATVSEGDCTASSGWTCEYLADHPEADRSLPVGFTAATIDDAKRMAIAFADSVG